MPKMKTHKGAKKRFKVTGTGKVMRKKAGKRHLLSVKNGGRRRRMRRDAQVLGPRGREIVRLIG